MFCRIGILFCRNLSSSSSSHNIFCCMNGRCVFALRCLAFLLVPVVVALAEPFREPVAWKALGLTDYPKVIKQPMDLGTIRDRLKKGQYKTLFQVGEDVRLVWTNCMTYNADGSDFYKLADMLHKKWDDKYTKLLQDCSAAAAVVASKVGSAGLDPAAAAAAATASSLSNMSSSAKASLQQKREFAKSLFTIGKEDLGRVLVEVEAKCPAAIVRNASEDELELNVDKIPVGLLKELSEFVNHASSSGGAGGGNNGKPKKKKATGAPVTKKTKTT